MRIFLLSIMALFIISCHTDSNGNIIIAKVQAVNNLKDICYNEIYYPSSTRYSDCECIGNSIGENLSVWELGGFANALSKIGQAQDIDIALVGGGISQVMDREAIYSSTSEISACCECDSELCAFVMVLSFAALEENYEANDMYYYPAWFSDWCDE